MEIAIYSRKSKYTNQGDSIGNQIQMCKDYIENLYKNKEINYSIYEDEGFSGKNTDRPEFQKLLKDIKKKKFDMLICYRLDRISRNVADFSSTLDKLQAYGVDFVSIKEQFDTSSPMGRAMIYIASVFAQLERETIAERVRDNMVELAKNGQWLGGSTPLGYTRKREVCIDENGNEKEVSWLIPEEKEIYLVKTIFETYLSEGSITKTEKLLIKNSILPPYNNFFSASTIHKILKNPLYAKSSPEIIKFLEDDGLNVYGKADNIHGILIYNRTSKLIKDGKRTDIVKDKSEWIAAVSQKCVGFIDPSMWLKAQKQLETNSSLSPRLGKTNTALLTGKLICGNCGSHMGIIYGNRYKSNQTIYYKCNLKKRSSGMLCNSKNLNGNKLDEYVLNELVLFGKNKKNFLDEIKKINSKNSQNIKIENRIKNIEKQITLKNKQLNGLLEKLALADDLTDIFMNKVRSLKAEIKSLKSQIDTVNEEIESNNNNKYDIDFINALLDKCINIKNEPFEVQKNIINYLIDEIDYNSKNQTFDIYPLGTKSKKKE